MEHVARELGVAFMTVKLWRRRYAESGLERAHRRGPGRAIQVTYTPRGP